MSAEEYTIEVQPDFVERQGHAQPIAALAEIIWNALDADATAVNVEFEAISAKPSTAADATWRGWTILGFEAEMADDPKYSHALAIRYPGRACGKCRRQG